MIVWGYADELLINWTCSLSYWKFVCYPIGGAWAWCAHAPLPISVEVLLPLIGNIDASPHNSWRMDGDINIATNSTRENMNVEKGWKRKARVTTRVKFKLKMKLNLNLKRVKVTKTANRHDITNNKRKKVWKIFNWSDFVKERVKFSFPNSCGNFLSPRWSINDTKKLVELT